MHHRYQEGGAKPISEAEAGEADADDRYISTGLIDAEFLSGLLSTRDADYYICGPEGFMTAMTGMLKDWRIPPSQIRLESFGPKTS